MERAECAQHAAFSRCHAVGKRLALDEISYLDTTPLTGFGADPLVNIIEIEEEAMTLALWIAQIVLALGFTLSGFPKVFQPVAKFRARGNWPRHVAPPVIRLIGSLEIFGALGLIVPKVTGYLPWLTPVAAVGLVLTMMGALLMHVRLHEAKAVGVPVVLLLLALFIAVGSFVFVPVG
jgi:uncharacterized membrane protein YphA (DoxX/SURF4 family)